MKASSFKDSTPRVKKIKKVVEGRCLATGKQALWIKMAERRAAKSDDLKGGMVAYKCPFGKTHWHVGHNPFAQKGATK